MARKRFSQIDLAELLHLSVQSCSRRLLGQVPFRDGEIVKITEQLGIDVSVLFQKSA